MISKPCPNMNSKDKQLQWKWENFKDSSNSVSLRSSRMHQILPLKDSSKWVSPLRVDILTSIHSQVITLSKCTKEALKVTMVDIHRNIKVSNHTTLAHHRVGSMTRITQDRTIKQLSTSICRSKRPCICKSYWRNRSTVSMKNQPENVLNSWPRSKSRCSASTTSSPCEEM